MGGRYVPKTYNNRRVLRIIVRVVLSAALAAVILFVSLFVWLKERYAHYNPDGTIRLEIPFLMDDPPAED
ncbi:MAG: hypothetical protein LBH28_04170 [Oscillospiraceae bacterium]|jgi:hypothetical protein|nr:hypothetical protein [Oscillospiraceae bacterium]